MPLTRPTSPAAHRNCLCAGLIGELIAVAPREKRLQTVVAGLLLLAGFNARAATEKRGIRLYRRERAVIEPEDLGVVDTGRGARAQRRQLRPCRPDPLVRAFSVRIPELVRVEDTVYEEAFFVGARCRVSVGRHTARDRQQRRQRETHSTGGSTAFHE